MTQQEFIKKIASYVKKYAPSYGIKVYSPIIAQACLESAYGTSELATKAHNYFGLKYRKGRCPTCIGTYVKVGSEQNKDGSYTSSSMTWCKFKDMENGVIGYFDFINISNYSKLKGVTDPKTYLERIKEAGYATSLKYVDNLMNVIQKWNLTQYDKEGNTTAINITKKTSTHNTTASKGRDIKYIVIHYTAGTSSSAGKAANTASYFSTTSTQASADFIVDDATIVQYNPDIKNRYCWHCGGSKYSNKGGSLYGKAKNSNSIGIEICSTNSTGKVKNANDKTWKFTDAAVSKAVELTKYLMKTYGISSANVIRHYDVTGKLCPGIVGWNADSGDESKWKAFKAKLGSSTSTGSGSSSSSSTAKDNLYRVRKTWADSKSQIGAYAVLANAKAKADDNPGYYVFDSNGKVVYPTGSSSSEGFQSYLVKVTASSLNIRKGPGTNYAKTGVIKSKGIYTIVAESSGKGATKWGKLKSGAGWISLDYCKKM